MMDLGTLSSELDQRKTRHARSRLATISSYCESRKTPYIPVTWCVDLPGGMTTMNTVELWQAIELGTVSSNSRVWREGLDTWTKVYDVPELVLACGATTPPGVVLGDAELFGKPDTPTLSGAATPSNDAEAPRATRLRSTGQKRVDLLWGGLTGVLAFLVSVTAVQGGKLLLDREVDRVLHQEPTALGAENRAQALTFEPTESHVGGRQARWRNLAERGQKRARYGSVQAPMRP